MKEAKLKSPVDKKVVMHVCAAEGVEGNASQNYGLAGKCTLSSSGTSRLTVKSAMATGVKVSSPPERTTGGR